MRTTFEAAAISELARRTLQSSDVTIRAGLQYGTDIERISTSLSDASPALMIAANHIEVESNAIMIELTDLPGGIIGGEEPDGEIVWIPGDVVDIWCRYLGVLVNLANAGYPGCVGCAGPAAELTWDELLSRRRLT